MNSAVLPTAAFRHDHEPAGSLISPGCTQIVGARELLHDRPLVERSPSEPPAGRSVPTLDDPATEVDALAALLAEVVELARDRAVFPGRWAQVAELAVGHESVRRALQDLRGAAS